MAERPNAGTVPGRTGDVATMIQVWKVELEDPEEGSGETVERLLDAVDHRLPVEVVRPLIAMTAMATGSSRVSSMLLDPWILEKLAFYDLVRFNPGGKVILRRR